MRKVFLFIALAVTLAAGCKKDETTEQADTDDKIINDYLTAHNLTATKDDSGVYYIITKEGSGGHPNLTHTVVVDYKGYLTDGTVFDESANALELQLAQLINGFQIGINKMQPGGKGTIFIPSQLGYGNKQVGVIPPNSVLIFDVELVEFY